MCVYVSMSIHIVFNRSDKINIRLKEILFFLVIEIYSIYPTPAIYTLHKLHGHLSGFHVLILFLNSFKEFVSFFSSDGIIAHTFGPKWAKDSVPYFTVCTLRVAKIFLEQYLTVSLSGNTLDISSGDILFTTL